MLTVMSPGIKSAFLRASTHSLRRVAGLIGLMGMALAGHAQLIPGAPGISKPWLSPPGLVESGSGLVEEGNRFLEGLSLSMGTTLAYDSNINQANGRDQVAEADWILSLRPAVIWETPIRDFTLILDASANYDAYASRDDFSGLDYRGEVELEYEGGPLTLGASLNHGSTQGVDRFAGGLIEMRTSALGLKTRYALSSKTALDASFSATDTRSASPDGTAVGADTAQTEFQCGALWQASPLIRLGPGVRSTWASSENEGDRFTLGPMLRMDYLLSEKVDLGSRIGLDFVEFDAGASDRFFSAAAILNYRLDALWTFNFEIGRDTMPDIGAGGGFRESTQWRMGIVRKVLAAQLDLGFGRQNSVFPTSSGRSPRAPVDYLFYDAGLGVPLFGDRARGRIFLRHQDNSSKDSRQDWNGLQSGISLSFRF